MTTGGRSRKPKRRARLSPPCVDSNGSQQWSRATRMPFGRRSSAAFNNVFGGFAFADFDVTQATSQGLPPENMFSVWAASPRGTNVIKGPSNHSFNKMQVPMAVGATKRKRKNALKRERRSSAVGASRANSASTLRHSASSASRSPACCAVRHRASASAGNSAQPRRPLKALEPGRTCARRSPKSMGGAWASAQPACSPDQSNCSFWNSSSPTGTFSSVPSSKSTFHVPSSLSTASTPKPRPSAETREPTRSMAGN
mmetsp:Transcript_14073/g.38493  ORF Transcript_14073/g.38493 Transcript_14073/m.38493 type:complete len:256 (-) Transcript_14073:17-784(-)